MSDALSARFMTSKEVATMIQVSRSAVQRWIDAGELRAFKTPGGHRRVTPKELVAFLRKHGMPVPVELDRHLRLLVVDDEAPYVRALRTLLATAMPRVEVETAESALDALVIIGARRPDVVLLDAHMPGMSGIDACRAIKMTPETRDIVVIGMSGRAGDTAAKMKASGASTFLTKPFTAQDVAQALHALNLLEEPPVHHR